MSTDVLLGQSYFLRFDPKLWAAMQPYPPLGTLYAAAYLRARAAIDVGALRRDAGRVRGGVGRRRSTAHRPRVAVLYEDNFNYLSKMCLLRMREAAFTMIDAAARARHARYRRRLGRHRPPADCTCERGADA